MPIASAASGPSSPSSLSSVFTISCTCSFCAPPCPTTASFTSRGAYSNTAGSVEKAAHSAAPRAWPSLRALSALRCMNTRSMATSRGRMFPHQHEHAFEDLPQARRKVAARSCGWRRSPRNAHRRRSSRSRRSRWPATRDRGPGYARSARARRPLLRDGSAQRRPLRLSLGKSSPRRCLDDGGV